MPKSKRPPPQEVMTQSGGDPSKGTTLDLGDRAQTGDGHWLTQKKKEPKK